VAAMDKRQQFSGMVQEHQAITQQIAALQGQLSELEATVDYVKSQPEDRAIYRNAGAVLVEVDDRASLQNDLKSTIERVSLALERYVTRENEIKAAYETLAKELEGSK